MSVSHKKLFLKLIGNWHGTVRTWFEPEKLTDEAKISGSFSSLVSGKFLRHSYESTIQGKTRKGEETVVQNEVTKNYEVSWFDSFHMNYAILFSTGKATQDGFSVFSQYDIAKGVPPWGWRTEYRLIDDNSLIITSYNVTPEGQESKAIEVIYHRISQNNY